MNTLKIIIFLLLFFITQLKAQIQPLPEKFDLINFVYEQKSNLTFENDRVYADSLFWKLHFPTLKFIKVNHPKTENFICGYILLKKIDAQHKEKLFSIMYHQNQLLKGVYDRNKNKTVLYFERNDAFVKNLYKTYCNKSYSKFSYKVIIDYNNNTIETRYPSINYNSLISDDKKVIRFDTDNNYSGRYFLKTKFFDYDNIIELLPNSSEKITPGILFTNNLNGVKLLTSISQITELKTVSYQ